MKQTKYKKSKLSGKGFYIALAVCLLAVAVATAIAISRTMTSLDNQNLTLASESSQSSTAQANEAQSGVEKSSASSVASSTGTSGTSKSQASSSAGSASAAAAAEPASVEYTWPVTGDVINTYSDGQLVKSETMGDWRTHDGIDIAASKATPVKAAADGTVSAISNDDMMGTCITIDHSDGMQTIYCGLNEEVQVKVDQEVQSGDVIGSVGTSNQLESAEPEHLHFAMKKDGKYVNPQDYIQ